MSRQLLRDYARATGPWQGQDSSWPFLSSVIGGVRKKATEEGEACHSGKRKL